MARATHAPPLTRPLPQVMTDAERVLAMLIHDVRTPLGVAHGYLRLIRGDKLPGAADRDRALADTQNALAKVSRLCQDAGAFLEDPPPAGTGRVPAAQLLSRVGLLLGERGIGAADPPETAGMVAAGTSVDRTAEAIVTLLALRAPKAPDPVAFAATGDTLSFSIGAPGGAAATDGSRPFDPWAPSQGLGVVAAHRLFTALGGQVRTGHGLALALTMPMESSQA